jgi:hypothetical protein
MAAPPPLAAPKVRNPEELGIRAKPLAAFGVNIYVTDAQIDVGATGSTNVEQML